MGSNLPKAIMITTYKTKTMVQCPDDPYCIIDVQGQHHNLNPEATPTTKKEKES